MHFGFWDIALVVGVCAQTTAIAYCHHPRHKALIYTLPIPFTLAALAVGRPIDTTNMGGLLLQLFYIPAVCVLHVQLRWPIVAAIAGGALLYALAALPLARFLPSNNLTFWVMATLCLLIGVALLRRLPPREEPGHRTPMAVWFKVPIIAIFIIALLFLKQSLHGFLTFFPMVGLVGAYEARHSLRTMARQVPVMLLTIAPLLMACRLTQSTLGMPVALAVGWAVFGLALMVVTRLRRSNAREAGQSSF